MVRYGLAHVEWHTNDDGDRVEGSYEDMVARAKRFNLEWPRERWLVVPIPASVDSPPTT